MALVFVGLPFVVRTLQPIIGDLPREVEEAAATLGATAADPSPRGAAGADAGAAGRLGAALARGVGEYGSVIFIAGNIADGL